VQAGELWWEGKHEAFSAKLDKMMPASLSAPVQALLSKAAIKPLGDRLGAAWRVGDIRKVEDTIAYLNFWKACMEPSVAAIESAERAQSSIAQLRRTIEDFRGAIKNDMTSMKAASERVQNEVLQMGKAYKQAADILIAPDFKQAIENAERLVTALQAIQQLTSTKVSVAVFSGGKDGHATV